MPEEEQRDKGVWLARAHSKRASGGDWLPSVTVVIYAEKITRKLARDTIRRLADEAHYDGWEGGRKMEGFDLFGEQTEWFGVVEVQSCRYFACN